MHWFDLACRLAVFCRLAVLFVSLLPVQALATDLTPPRTSVSQPGRQYSSSLTINLRCEDYWGSGCDSTFYCLGEDCTPTTPYDGSPIRIIENSTVRFYSTGKASDPEPVQTEQYTVVYPDRVAPVVTALVVPPVYRSLTVPVTFNATDEVGVVDYCLTETNDSASCKWQQAPPAVYTFASGGSHTLYAFARDAGGNISLPVSASLSEDPSFIRVQQLSDMVYDKGRDILYLASAGSILRYKVSSRSFLSPYQTSGTLSGLDISPDNRTLAVADSGRVSLYLIDLDNGSITEKSFTASSGEDGIRSVAFASDGSLLVASNSAGDNSSLTAPLRRYDPATGGLSIIDNLKRATVVPNAGRSCLGVEEGQWPGMLGIYDVATQRISKKTTVSLPTSVVGISRDCTQVADSGDVYSNETLEKAASLASYGSVVFHPNLDVVFIGIANSATLSAYETKNFRSVATYDTGNALSYSGPLRIAPDASLLFARVVDGVEVIPLSPLLPQNQAVIANQGSSVPIQLKATTAQSGDLSFRVDLSPQHGVLAGTPPNLTYTPDASFEGSDRFTFNVSNSHGENGNGTVVITVAHDVIPPVITSFAVPAASSTPLVPITALAATDNVGVTGYCLTTSNSTYDCTWTKTPPASFDFTNTYLANSPHTLYLFASDAAGNVSLPATATVSVNTGGYPPPPPQFTLPPLSSFYAVPQLKATAVAGTQYCLTEVNDLAQCTPYSWQPFLPSYEFAGYGPHTLYLFAMSSTGKVSSSASATTTVIGNVGNEIPLDPSFSTTGVAFDPGRHTLFIAGKDKLLRYDMQARSFLAPLLEGKSLAGVDVSADGNTLVAGNATGVGIFLVDLRTELSTQVDFTPVGNEPKTSGVFFGSDGAVIVAGSSLGGYANSVPVRRYDPSTGDTKTIVTLAGGWYSTTVSRSPGGRCFGITDGNGNAQIYQTASQTVTATRLGVNTAVIPNRDCSQVAIGNTFYDGTMTRSLGTIPSSYMGVSLAFDPFQDIVYSLDGNTFVAYDTNSFAQLAIYPTQGAYALPGMRDHNAPVALSPDGSFVFARYYDGIGYAKLVGAVAEKQSISIASVTTPITLLGRSSRAATLSYRVVTPPSHGSLGGTPPNLVYSVDPGYLGKDTFTFSVNDGTEESDPAPVTISIASSQPSPQTVSLSVSLPNLLSSPVVSVSLFSYGNSTGDLPVDPVQWCLTESPSAASCTWSAKKPAFYVFSGDFPQGRGVNRTLYAYLMDGTGKISPPGSASVTITMPDTTAPTILGFNMPENYPGLKVPYTLLTSDNAGRWQYCLADTNDSASCVWNYVGDGQHTVSLTYGSHTFYAFARDSSGNVSASSKATVYAYKPPVFTAVPDPSFLVGTGATYQIIADGYPVPTLTLSGALPEGVVFTTDGHGSASLSGTPKPGSAGTYPITVKADVGIGPAASKDLTVTVTRVKQSLTYAPLSSKAVTDPPFTISAVASSGLPVTITSSNPSVATVEGATVTIRGCGHTELTVVQRGDGTYEPVTVTHVLSVGVKTVESVLTLSALSDGDTSNAMVINVAGQVVDTGTVKSLSVNDSPVAIGGDGFFSLGVGLVPGINSVATTVLQKDGSSVTDVRTIYLEPLPAFQVSTPADNAVVNDPTVKVSGAGGKGVLQVAINSAAPITVAADSGGSFSFTATLAEGLNTILVSTVDEKGNRFTAKRSLLLQRERPYLSIGYPDQDALLYDPNGYRGVSFEIHGETGPGTDNAVTVEVAGKSLTPPVQSGWFSQRVEFPRAGVYPIQVTARTKAGASSTTMRTVVYVSSVPDGILVPATGKTVPDVSDALRALRIAVGAITPTLADIAHGDVAPLQNGLPKPDGTIGVEDALLILERAVGVVTW